ncbi:MAG TPA: TIGR03086 family metal-binding protein [Streptosporangiaceae bacterium]
MAFPSDGVGLLERALGYALAGLDAVTPDALPGPTPCRGWDLRALLAHLNDSLAALGEAADDHCVDLEVVPWTAARNDLDAVARCRDRARRMLGSWAGEADRAGDRDRVVAVGGRPMRSTMVACVGAVEVAVHGWDIQRSCGRPRPIPPALAAELLEIVPMLVTGAERPAKFAAPVPVAPSAPPGDRLVAFLGRDPR